MPTTPKPVKRRDGTLRWRVQFREHRGSSPTTETFDTPEEAQRFIDYADRFGWTEARRLRDGMLSHDLDIPTLGEWFEQHLEALASHATPGTVAGYRTEAARTWLPRLGSIPLDILTREQIQAWVAWQRKQLTHRSRVARDKAKRAATNLKPGTLPPPMPEPQYVAPKTIENAQRLLSTVLASADERYGTGNPAKGVQIPADATPHEMCFLTQREFQRIYDACHPYYRPLLALLAGTGVRFGEATALTPADFDLDGDVPSVRVSKAWKKGESGVYLGAPKSRRSLRTISLSPSTVAAIRDAIESRERDSLAFPAPGGGRLRHQNFHPRIWHKAVSDSGILKRPRVHDLRHTHASWLIHEGVPLPVIQRRLGHESIQTTVDTYGHIMPDAAAAAATAVERAMGEFDPGLIFTGQIEPPSAASR